MTGRDLIIYILENNLENELVFENNKFLGFMTPEEVALKCNVGVETVKLWYERGIVKGIKIGDIPYISSTSIKTLFG